MDGYVAYCETCGRRYEGIPLSCPLCGGLVLLRYPEPRFEVDRSKPGVWRYSLLPKFPKAVSKGEGLTPVSSLGGVLVKNERFNPTGTYADRASAVLASYLVSSGVNTLRVRLEEDFTTSLAYYLAYYAKLYVVVSDALSLGFQDLLMLEDLGVELVSVGRAPPVTEVSYANPLTVEGLKTIAFEVYEKRVKAENVVVPAATGLLALSVAKGLEELREAGHDHHYIVTAAVLRGRGWPNLLQRYGQVKVEEVGEDEALEALVRLSKRGVKTKLLSALSYLVAENLGSSLAVVTMGFKRPARRTEESGRLREELLRALSELGEATAYELWKRVPAYTLRGTYKALLSMERLGEVCSETRSRGRRKVKYYKPCPTTTSGHPPRAVT